MIKKLISIMLLLTLCSCASYKSTWDCPKVRGIGCSSVEYADQVAREQIISNQFVKHIDRICDECNEKAIQKNMDRRAAKAVREYGETE